MKNPHKLFIKITYAAIPCTLIIVIYLFPLIRDVIPRSIFNVSIGLYLGIGSIISSIFKVPLYSKKGFFRTESLTYDSIDTLANIAFSIIGFGFASYILLSELQILNF